MKLVNSALLIAAFAIALPAAAQTKGAAPAAADKGTMNMEILREKVKADKKLIVAHNMKLTDAEGKGFWPIYDAYQKDLGAINDRMVKVVTEYADAYNKGPVLNPAAKKLLNDALAIEDAELKLKRAYVSKLEKVLPDVKVALYMQIENKIRAVLKFELAANIPLVE